MCGIIGYWESARTNVELSLEASLGLLQHRGPDQAATIHYKHGKLGATRLQIIGLQSGQQPIEDGEGNVLVFNGALYNFKALGKQYNCASESDSETLLSLLKMRGESILSELEGMFAFAYYDSKKEALLLARDRLGQKPLYFFNEDHKLYFSSELPALKSLLKAKGTVLTINPNAVYQYLSFANIPEPNTIYRGVKSLEAGSYLWQQKDRHNKGTYWELNYHPKNNDDLQTIRTNARSLIQKAVKSRLVADVPIGLFLSSGWDSSVIAYEIAALGKKVDCYTVEYPFKTSQNEASIAAETAKKLGLPHHKIAVEYKAGDLLQEFIESLGQPHADSSALPMLAITGAAKRNVKVMLSGDGGDELFAGYRRYFLAQHEKLLSGIGFLENLIPTNQRRNTLGFLKRSGRIAKTEWPEKYLAYTTDMLKEEDLRKLWKIDGTFDFSQTKRLINTIDDSGLGSLDRLMNLDRQLNFRSGILSKYDQISMHHSLEARSPFLDHSLYEFMAQLPDQYKVQGYKRKYLLKNIYTDKLPNKIINIRKLSFEAPLQHWMENEFAGILSDVLTTSNAKIYDYLDKQELTHYINQHHTYNQNRNDTYVHFAILVLALWLERNA